MFAEDVLTGVRVTEAVGEDAKLEATVAGADVADLRGAVELVDVSTPTRQTLFRGWVTTATAVGEAVRINARSAPWLDEYVFSGFEARLTHEEFVWTLGRLAGLEPEDMYIDGLELAGDSFVVVAPLRGVQLSADIEVGGVRLTRQSAGVVTLIDFVNDVELRTEFLAPGIWAVAQTGPHDSLFAAEQAGVDVIDGALQRLALDENFTSVRLPDGRRRDHQRWRRLGNPGRAAVILTVGKSDRRWLHSVQVLTKDLQATRPSLEMLRTPNPTVDPVFDLALAAWRRATIASGSAAVAGAIWEALEFYVAGSPLDALFSVEERAEVARLAREALGLSEAQKARISEVIGQFLNQPPVIPRLERALESAGIPFTPLEIAALRRVRRTRTQAQHGEP